MLNKIFVISISLLVLIGSSFAIPITVKSATTYDNRNNVIIRIPSYQTSIDHLILTKPEYFVKIVLDNKKSTVIVNGQFFDMNTGNMVRVGRKWGSIYGVTLVDKGQISYAPKHEGFITLDTTSMVRRTAIGYDRKGYYIIAVGRQHTLKEMAILMKNANCYFAIGLDGGSSSGLYAQGIYYLIPNRKMTNVLIFKEKE
jgi:exopolysaccharide biosynthesis protein